MSTRTRIEKLERQIRTGAIRLVFADGTTSTLPSDGVLVKLVLYAWRCAVAIANGKKPEPPPTPNYEPTLALMRKAVAIYDGDELTDVVQTLEKFKHLKGVKR